MGMFVFKYIRLLRPTMLLQKVLAEEGMDISHVEFFSTMLLSMIIFLKIYCL